MEDRDQGFDWTSDWDVIEAAWGLIANAYGGNWDEASPEWRKAAERWRDEGFLPRLAESGETP